MSAPPPSPMPPSPRDGRPPENTSIDSRKFISVNLFTALLENVLFYPFEFLKTRQQAVDIGSSFRPLEANPRSPPPARDLGKQLDLKTQIRQTYNTSGPRGFYRGFSWFVVANVPADMVYLYGYAMSKQTLLDTDFGKKYPTAAYMISGAAGDFFSIVLVVPLEVVAQRLQIQDARIRMHAEAIAAGDLSQGATPMKAKNGFQICYHIARTEGIRGLFRGTGMSIIYFLPSSATWWGVAEAAKKMWARSLGISDTNPIGFALAGATAGTVTSLMMNPIDVIKTRLQTSQVKTTAFRVARDLAVNGGFFAFYRGIVPRMSGHIPRSAWGMVVFQFIVSVSQNTPAEQTVKESSKAM